MQRRLADVAHQLVIGAAYDSGTTDFAQGAQPATFRADRETVGTGDYVAATDVTTTNRSLGVYVADTMLLAPQWSLSLSGRYNAARVATRDLTGDAPAVDGENSFRRFNPAAGLTWMPSAQVNAFAGINQGTRVPTAVELTCADPAAPCTLPNIFVADPPLKQVVATTFEAGLRGRVGATGFYSAAIYRTDLADDIQFIGAGTGAVNAGYFQNVGKTRRQGVELSGGTTWGEVRVVARYSFLDATFQTGFVASSPNNASADADGLIYVSPGDRLPTLPRNALRVRADWTHGPFALGASVLAVDSQYSRGNENNADPSGKVPGYALVALDGVWNLTPEWQLFARVDNLFNRSYQNFGILGANYFRGPGNSFDVGLAGPEAFRSPGPTIGAWIGIQFRFDRSATAR
jgi:outer membrane receptor protein involved in Fe transport